MFRKKKSTQNFFFFHDHHLSSPCLLLSPAHCSPIPPLRLFPSSPLPPLTRCSPSFLATTILAVKFFLVRRHIFVDSSAKSYLIYDTVI